MQRGKTQKANGVYAIATGRGPAGESASWSSRIAKKSKLLMWEVEGMIPHFPLFARPCPIKPRHGFVESRVVNNSAEVFQVVRETLEQDAEGEVILAPVIDACWSAVATENSVSIGAKNDGATSGKALLTLPLMRQGYSGAVKFSQWGLASTDSAYFEFVHDNDCLHLVQIRGGPSIPAGAKNYIPEAVKVQKVIRPGYPLPSLLQWEKTVKTEGKTPGSVIWLPEMSLASHWAIHGIQNNFPVYTGEDCPIYKSLEPESPVIPEPSKDELKDLARQMEEVEFNWPYPRPTEALKLTLLVFHNSLLWPWGPKENKLRAHGVMAAAALGTVACLGELRHWNREGPGKAGISLELSLPFLAKHNESIQRDAVYDYSLLNLTWDQLGPLWAPMREGFNHPLWYGNYGGKKWATCTRKSEALNKRIQIFKKGPTSLRWRRVIAALNDLLNVAHNGGKLFTKWLSLEMMNVPYSFPSSCIGEAVGHCLGLPSPNWENPRVPLDLTAVFAFDNEDDEEEKEEEED